MALNTSALDAAIAAYNQAAARAASMAAVNPGEKPRNYNAYRDDPAVRQPLIDAYNAVNREYESLYNQAGALMPGADPAAVGRTPEVQAVYSKANNIFQDLTGRVGEPNRNAGFSQPLLNTGNGSSGFGNLLKGLALTGFGALVTPPLGAALGSSLGVGTALGSGLAGAGIGGLTGALTGSSPLLGALTGGVGGYFSGGGFGDLTEGLGVGDLFSGTPDVQRAATSAAATTTSPNLTGYLPSGGGIAGGGSSGGFFDLSSIDYGALSPSAGPVDLASGISSSGIGSFGSTAPSLLSDPGAYLGNLLEQGVDDVFSPSKLLSGGLKGALGYALERDNAGGFGAVQNAANQAAQNFQPFYQSGVAANKRLSDLYGLNGADAGKAAMSAFQTNPGYQFALQQGIDALDTSAAKRGMLLSGNQAQAVQEYGTGLANQFFQQYLNDLARTSGQGQSAAGNIGQNTVDAAQVYALQKAAGANRYNQLLDSILSSAF